MEVTPQQFADLPFRMRRGTADGSTIIWHIRNGPSERGELAIRHILGRWYEPVAVHHWGGVSERCHLKHMAKNRAETSGFRGIYSSQDPADAVDGKTPRKAMLASPGGSNASNSKQRGITPERGFKSVNAPGSITKSKMALAVEGDDEEEDDGSDVEEVEVDPAVFGKSPTKRLAFRQTSLDK